MKRTHITFVIVGLLSSSLLAQVQPQPGRRAPVIPPGAAAGPSTRRAVIPPPDPNTGLMRPTDAPAADLSGEWAGVYTVNDTVIRADLTLTNDDATKRKLSGQIHAVSVPAPQPRGQPPVPLEGTWKVSLTLDPGSGLLMIAQEGVIKASAGAVLQPASFRGVYAAGAKQIAGQSLKLGGTNVTSPYFLFARAADAATIKTLAEHASAAIAQPAPGEGTPPSDDALAKWAAKYQQEYPNSAQQDPDTKIVIQTLPLLSDADFKPVFSEAFDTIDYGKLALAIQRLGGAVGRAPAPPRTATPAPRPARPTPEQLAEQQKQTQELAEKIQAARQAGDRAEVQRLAQEMAGVTTPGGARPAGAAANRAAPAFIRQNGFLLWALRPEASRIVDAAAVRVLDAWSAGMQAHFEKDAPVASAFDDMAAVQAAMAERLTYAWPSDKKSWDPAYEKLRTTTADATLAASLEKARIQPATLATARALAAWSTDNATLVKYLAADKLAAARKQVDDRLDAVLDALLEQSRASFAKIRTGASGIGDGVRWYQSLMSDFQFAADRPPLKKLIADLMAERQRGLEAGRADILQAIANGKDTEALESLILLNLSVPGDRQLPAYAPIAAALTKRRGEIDHDHMMSLFSEDEKKIMDKPGHVDVSKGKDLKPNKEDVRLAIVRAFAEDNGEVIDAHTVRMVTRLTGMPFLPFAMVIKFEDLDSLSLVDGEKSGEFECFYKVHQTVTIPQDNIIAGVDPAARQGVQQGADLANLADRAADEEKEVTVILTETGWRVPGADKLGVIDNMIGRMMGQ